MNTFRIPTLIALAATLFTSIADAQVITDSRTKTWSHVYGSGSFGGSASANANMTRRYISGQTGFSNFTSSADVTANVKVFGSTYEAAKLGVAGQNELYNFTQSGSTWTATAKSGYAATTNAYLRLIGSTVWNPQFSGGSFNKQWTMPVLLLDTPHVSASFNVLGIPITVSAWATASANLSFHVSANVSTASLSATGSAGASASGTASAGVGWSWASAGVSFTMKFAAPSISLGINGSPAFGINGTLTVNLPGIQLKLDLYAKLFRRRATYPIYTWSAGSQPAYTQNF